MIASKLQENISNAGQMLTLSSITFDDAHDQLAVTDANGNTSITKTDTLGRITAATDSLGHSVVSTYDAINHIINARANEGNLVSLFDVKSSTPLTAREIDWDLTKDHERIDIKKPGPIITEHAKPNSK